MLDVCFRKRQLMSSQLADVYSSKALFNIVYHDRRDVSPWVCSAKPWCTERGWWWWWWSRRCGVEGHSENVNSLADDSGILTVQRNKSPIPIQVSVAIMIFGAGVAAS